MQAHTLAHKFGADDVALEELAEQENPDDERNALPIRPELCDRHARGDHQSGHRADIGDERDQAGDEADDQGKIEPRQHQSNRVIAAEHEAYSELPAQTPAYPRLDLAGEPAHRSALP